MRSELRDEAGLPFAITIHAYDGAAFQGLPEGQTDLGLLTRTQELVLLESRLPIDYVGDPPGLDRYTYSVDYSIREWWNKNRDPEETIRKVGHDENPWEKNAPSEDAVA